VGVVRHATDAAVAAVGHEPSVLGDESSGLMSAVASAILLRHGTAMAASEKTVGGALPALAETQSG